MGNTSPPPQMTQHNVAVDCGDVAQDVDASVVGHPLSEGQTQPAVALRRGGQEALHHLGPRVGEDLDARVAVRDVEPHTCTYSRSMLRAPVVWSSLDRMAWTLEAAKLLHGQVQLGLELHGWRLPATIQSFQC